MIEYTVSINVKFTKEIKAKMFRKLVSNLPFNPSLLGEVSFYYSRLKQEEKLRRLGMAMVVLSMFIQLFAVLSPPQSTLARSSNDVIDGGFAKKEQAVMHCRADTQGFRDVLAYHGISCDRLEQNAVFRSVKSTDHGGTLRSMGRESRGDPNYRTGKRSYEEPLRIGGTTYYMRNLTSFDSGNYSTYSMLKVINAHGDTIYIMYDCGNIVTPGKYTPPPPPPTPPSPPPEPNDACPGDNDPGLQKSKDECDVCLNIEGVQKPGNDCDVCPYTDDVQRDYDMCDVCENIPGDQFSSDDCFPCPEADDPSAVAACIKPDKTASNVTQNIDDANGTMAKANDTIVYTLTVSNTGRADMPDFTFEEDMSDILQYSTLIDADGGTLNDEEVLSWAPENIPAKSTVEKSITVKVKDPIPQTPVSTSDPDAYDLVMNNTFYGKSVNIELPRSVNKTVEIATKTLPSTGPGESMMLAAVITVFVSYFFARAHLLRKETQLVRLNYSSYGGNE